MRIIGLMENGSVLLIGEVSRHLQVAPETIRRWVRTGKIAARRAGHGVRVFDAEEVERVARERQAGLEVVAQ